jgi:hypothetical protein
MNLKYFSLTLLLTFLCVIGYSQTDKNLIGAWVRYSNYSYVILAFSDTLIFKETSFEQIIVTENGKRTVDEGDYEINGDKLVLKTKMVTGRPEILQFEDRKMTFKVGKRKLKLVEEFDAKYTEDKKVAYQTKYFKKVK